MKTIITLLTLVLPASAYWPVIPEENFPFHADTTLYEGYCTAQSVGNSNILVIYELESVGICFQIIDRYGEFIFPLEQNIVIGQPSTVRNGIPVSISDGNNGAYVVWETVETNTRLLAQHIDSVGTRLWGDSGIVAFELGYNDFDLCLDNEGGLYIAVSPVHPGGNWTDLYLQHIEYNGNLLWGENGILLNQPNEDARYPIICPDTSGGCFLVWNDWRPPYGGTGALFAQHIAFSGDILWPNDLFITSGTVQNYGIKTIPDEAGGFILQSNVNNLQYNHHRRINGNGNILWVRDHLSYWSQSPMVNGEPGFFYLGWKTGDICYGQRVDMNGNSYWPVGAAFNSWSQVNYDYYQKFFYFVPYFYVFYCISIDPDPIRSIYIQALDTLYNRQFGINGQLFSTFLWPSGPSYINPIVDGSGNATVVFEYYHYGLPPGGGGHDVWAKRMYADGTLGGPNAPIENVTIAVSGNDLVLTWPSMAPNADYKIYKTNSPYIQPAEPDTVVQDTVFTDVNGVSEGAGFYRVGWQP